MLLSSVERENKPICSSFDVSLVYFDPRFSVARLSIEQSF
ncbi:hypothetical protein PAMC26510_00400 [Caballeronia sordidicola]|uniref:Uncharacterized protein n=1 Tax=Caballeronia sordidicola TaxID=196367 RepID=A0A242NAE9_CABSO|nr:hypothetical protein PAMC26510_00400 [Caballeronia sordidicola]